MIEMERNHLTIIKIIDYNDNLTFIQGSMQPSGHILPTLLSNQQTMQLFPQLAIRTLCTSQHN